MIPSFNIPQIVRIRQKLLEDVFLEHHGYSYEGASFDELVRRIKLVLHGVSWETLYYSLRHLAGTGLNDKIIDEVSWRLAGNLAALRRGEVVLPWTFQAKPEWVPVQIMHAYRCRIFDSIRAKKMEGAEETVEKGKKKKFPTRSAVDIRMQVMAGTPAGCFIDRIWTESYTQMVRTSLGFSPWRRLTRENDIIPTEHQLKTILPLSDLTELTRLRMLAWITPKAAKNYLNYEKLLCVGGVLKWNRDLMRKRHRVWPFTCPLDYPLDSHPCYRCHQGYDRCKAACHPVTYVQQPCPRCKREKAWFDPGRKSDCCVACTDRLHVKRRK